MSWGDWDSGKQKAEAEEAGLGVRSPARGLANGGGLGAAPPARRGPGPRAG